MPRRGQEFGGKCPFPFATFIILDRSGLPATGTGMLIPKPPDITPPARRSTFTHVGPRIWITGLGRPGTPQTPRCILASQESQQPCSDQGTVETRALSLWRFTRRRHLDPGQDFMNIPLVGVHENRSPQCS